MADEQEEPWRDAGSSARREAERKRARRAQGTAQKSGAERFVAAIVGPSAKDKRRLAEEKHWATGAEGEQLLAKALSRRCPHVPVLHDRAMPNSRANIDHLAIAASGVYVIDAKRYRGKIEVRAPLFGNAKLMIAGRDRTKLVQGLDKQVAAVRAALEDIAPQAQVHGCLCFLAPEGILADSGLPVIRTLKINGHALYYPRRLAKRLNRSGGSGGLSQEQVTRIHAELGRKLPPA